MTGQIPRSTPRQRMLKGVKLVIGGRSTIDAILRDLSDTGARIRVENTVSLPETFELLHEDGRRPCRVVRRTINEIGVVFTDL
ncbi:PilZ domain-containing protein [Rhizobium sp. RU20A]|uniref:PilZ domain-containing protein n=1 Tax=Rhizobium sp. RU20A TaxID=1907412 RepID=UPI0009548EA1|nr:PilZ domain-containing protein [Rhizobium sp. RU20A]SIR09091.1 PilZ domain-containing protein [Rhizobium sp. RU20A]